MNRILSTLVVSIGVAASVSAQVNFQKANTGLPAESNILDFTRDDDGNIYTIASIVNDKAYLYKSGNEGSSWTVLSQTGLPTWFSSIQFFNNNLFVGTQEEGSMMYKSSDKGLSWNVCNTGLPSKCNILDFTVFGSAIYSIVSVVGDKAYIYKSENDGASWSQVNQKGLPAWFNSIQSYNNLLFVGTWEEGSILYKSSDSGLNWNPSNSGIPLVSNILGFTTVNNAIYAIVSVVEDKAYVYKSTNSGASWNSINQVGLPTWFNSIGSSSYALLVGTWDEGDYLYKSDDLLTSFKDEKERPAEFLFYPNPVEGTLYFILPMSGELYNNIGILVKKFDNVSSIDFTQLSAGIYSMKTEGVVKKILKR